MKPTFFEICNIIRNGRVYKIMYQFQFFFFLFFSAGTMTVTKSSQCVCICLYLWYTHTHWIWCDHILSNAKYIRIVYTHTLSQPHSPIQMTNFSDEWKWINTLSFATLHAYSIIWIHEQNKYELERDWHCSRMNRHTVTKTKTTTTTSTSTKSIFLIYTAF